MEATMSRLTRIAIATLLLVSLPLAARTPSTPASGTVSGYVTTISGNLITVLNGTVTIDASSAAFRNGRGSATLADVKPGSQIIAAIRNPQAPPGTVLQASSIMIVDTPAGTLSGPIQSVDLAGSALTIMGTRVIVTPSTRIVALRNGTATLADVKAGDHATIVVNINGSALVAESIHVMPPIPDVMLEGTVKSMDATSWVITTRNETVTIFINANTKIDSGIAVGDSVIVIGSRDAAGNVTAMAIMRGRTKPTR
ncbi:MAG TPA: DUF5666 domain-containing protein [Thermoanaerobaculia bacterium]|nr:DUF5666 domain-containing protein [Thermoanaerobaculia bacterium]